ncbi:ABC transporter permease [Mycoplasmopsis primatum]|uniref:ABC transporter permease n=1 Tax=Mycoplasmopsis primatum TaxID=55604 RepID=UPI0004984750|nr:ABC transporter permease subunit [Mycoplasmopsis primatum]
MKNNSTFSNLLRMQWKYMLRSKGILIAFPILLLITMVILIAQIVFVPDMDSFYYLMMMSLTSISFYMILSMTTVISVNAFYFYKNEGMEMVMFSKPISRAQIYWTNLLMSFIFSTLVLFIWSTTVLLTVLIASALVHHSVPTQMLFKWWIVNLFITTILNYFVISLVSLISSKLKYKVTSSIIIAPIFVSAAFFQITDVLSMANKFEPKNSEIISTDKNQLINNEPLANNRKLYLTGFEKNKAISLHPVNKKSNRIKNFSTPWYTSFLKAINLNSAYTTTINSLVNMDLDFVGVVNKDIKLSEQELNDFTFIFKNGTEVKKIYGFVSNKKMEEFYNLIYSFATKNTLKINDQYLYPWLNINFENSNSIDENISNQIADELNKIIDEMRNDVSLNVRDFEELCEKIKEKIHTNKNIAKILFANLDLSKYSEDAVNVNLTADQRKNLNFDKSDVINGLNILKKYELGKLNSQLDSFDNNKVSELVKTYFNVSIYLSKLALDQQLKAPTTQIPPLRSHEISVARNGLAHTMAEEILLEVKSPKLESIKDEILSQLYNSDNSGFGKRILIKPKDIVDGKFISQTRFIVPPWYLFVIFLSALSTGLIFAGYKLHKDKHYWE